MDVWTTKWGDSDPDLSSIFAMFNVIQEVGPPSFVLLPASGPSILVVRVVFVQYHEFRNAQFQQLTWPTGTQPATLVR